MTCKTWLSATVADFFEYKTPKIVQIRNKRIGVVNRLIQVGILLYIIVYAIGIKKGYQEFGGVNSSTTTKLKGSLSTLDLDDQLFRPGVNTSIYKKVWDVPDFVIPPTQTTESFFVLTNVVITPNQIRSSCAESPDVEGAKCTQDSDCVVGQGLPLGNGPMTGKCVQDPRFAPKTTCEIMSWCPVEDDRPVLKKKKPLLGETANFTVLIKSTATFSSFNIKRRNILDTQNQTFLKNCNYAPSNSANAGPLCPIFILKDIVKQAGGTYEEVGVKGGIFSININWDCNFDFDTNRCVPKYSFSRMDEANSSISPGWNFRFANYYDDDRRTLFKAYGIRFVVTTTGRGGKFNFMPLLINIGSGLGLMAITTIVCDFIAFYFATGKDYYKEKKYLMVDETEDKSYQVCRQCPLLFPM